MKQFNKAVIGALISLVLLAIFSGIIFSWRWNDLSNFGQFIGGIASAVALALVAYSLVIQQNQYALSIDELKQQTETLKSSNEAQLFNLLYSTLIQRSSDFSFVDEGTGPEPTRYQGISALETMADTYLEQTSLNNLRPLSERRSQIEALVRSYLQTLKFISRITNTEKRQLLAELVINQFTTPIQKIIEVENSANRIGINKLIFENLHQVVTELERA